MRKDYKITLQSVPQKYTVIVQIVTFLWLFSIIILSLVDVDKPDIPRYNWKHFDKIVHFGFYLGLQVLLMISEHLRNQRKLKPAENALLIFMVFSIGGFIEFLQFTFFQGRSGEFADLLFNTAGIFTAFFIMKLLIRRVVK